jgi:ATP-dependent Clp protease adapter protein ClpS
MRMQGRMSSMSDLVTKPRPKQRPEIARPRLYKVILLNDDFALAQQVGRNAD